MFPESDLENVRDRLDSNMMKVMKSYNEYLGFITKFKYKDYINENGKYKELALENKNILNTYEKLNKTIDTALFSVNAENSYKLLRSLIYRENNSGNNYTSLPFRLFGDIGTLDINIVPRDSNAPLQEYSTVIKFPDLINRSPVFGINTSFYFSGLHEETFSIITSQKLVPRYDSAGSFLKNDTLNNYKVVQNNSGDNEIGIQALLSIGWKLTYNFGLNIMFGPSININTKVRPRISAGAGIFYGKRNIITASGGWIGGNVDVLNEGIDLNSEGYSIKPEQLTNSKFRTSWFFSLGYTFIP